MEAFRRRAFASFNTEQFIFSLLLEEMLRVNLLFCFIYGLAEASIKLPEHQFVMRNQVKLNPYL